MVSKTFIYKKVDAVEIPALVHYAPPGEAESASAGTSKARPIAIMLHAGGYFVGSAAMAPATEIEVLNEMGFVVVAPEYRLCPQVSIRDGPLSDAADCLVWVREGLPALLKDAGVEVDPTKVVAMGHSAGGGMALYLGSRPNPPAAIADFCGMKYLREPFWTTPLDIFKAVPVQDDSFIAKVYEGPQVLSSPPMFTPDGKPKLSDPRSAKMISIIRDGTLLQTCQPDGDLDSIETTQGFAAKGATFPPTCFVHGTGDIFIPVRLAEKAHAELKRNGVETELFTLEGAPHVFDFRMKREDAGFQDVVMPALRFLKARV